MIDEYSGSLKHHILRTIWQLKRIKNETKSTEKQRAIQLDIDKLNERLKDMAITKALNKRYGVTGKMEESEKIWYIFHLRKLIEKYENLSVSQYVL